MEVIAEKQPKKHRSRSLDNLKPRWEKGESGNPAGRPKLGHSIADTLRTLGSQKHATDPEGRTRFQVMLDRVQTLAEQGEEWAVKFIAERTEGKVAETVNLNSDQPDKVIFERVAAASP